MSYRIRATLDPAIHVVRATMDVRWTNTSSRPATTLLWHLYLNAFRDQRSVFAREAPAGLRGRSFGAPGRIDVVQLRAGSIDLLPTARRELVPGDTTQLETPLPSAVAPGATLELSVVFRAVLPEVSARTGWARDLHVVAQWFPKLARLEPDGTWRSFAFHANGEFYADFGSYDVEITAPEDQVVAATGVSAGRRRNAPGRVVHTFRADRVHDFAFVASPSLRPHRRRVGAVDVTALAYPGYERAADAALDAVAFGIPWLSRRFGPYPYPALTVLMPPLGAEGAAGMEYPTLFASGGPWLTLRGVHVLHEHVALHELAHQWFQGMVATDESRWPMLDEGLTEWATARMLRERHGARCSAAHISSLCVSMDTVHRFAAVDAMPSLAAAHDYPPSAYGASVYFQPALVLETARRVWGARLFDEALRRYAMRGRFSHPTPETLFRAFEETHGATFVDSFLRPALADGVGAGWALGRTLTWPLTTERKVWQSEVDVRRVGGLEVPTVVALRYADGRSERVRIDPRRTWTRLVRTSTSALMAAEVDPDRRIPMDASFVDNARSTAEAPSRTSTLGLRLVALGQALLSWVGP
ncbi:MAG: M1 family metallopeptidase [Deltaproteobacteria bacterium]|nr:M1 family metallopeptidase [Deltaproteobacteria bacterium]